MHSHDAQYLGDLSYRFISMFQLSLLLPLQISHDHEDSIDAHAHYI